MIDELAIVIVGDKYNSRDIILHRRNVDVQQVSETHRLYDTGRNFWIFVNQACYCGLLWCNR